jgi:carboxymethylenebutenolidase
MCYDADSAPPLYGPPITSTTSARLLLTAADGAPCAAYRSLPAQALGPGVLVLPDNRGLSGFYEALTRRLAEQGLPALAIDYFGRSAGPAYEDRPASFAELPNLMPHLRALTRDGLYADFDAALEHLRGPEAGEPRAVISLGFCMGGRFAFLTAHHRFALAAPVLGLFAGADEGIPAAMVAAFDDALAAAGNAREIVTYPGAPHGFFEAEADAGSFADECADVWRRVLAFARERAA